MAKFEITKRQQYCLKHIRAADARKGTPVDYANAHDLNVKDLYQWTDNLFIERLLRSLKYECVCLNAIRNLEGLSGWLLTGSATTTNNGRIQSWMISSSVKSMLGFRLCLWHHNHEARIPP